MLGIDNTVSHMTMEVMIGGRRKWVETISSPITVAVIMESVIRVKKLIGTVRDIRIQILHTIQRQIKNGLVMVWVTLIKDNLHKSVNMVITVHIVLQDKWNKVMVNILKDKDGNSKYNIT